MRLSFSYTLLITWFLLSVSCKTNVVVSNAKNQNLSVSEIINPLDSQIVQIYLPYKKILEKDMERIISYSESDMVKDKPESKLTNFLADLLLDSPLSEIEKEGVKIHPHVSYFNYGGIRTSLPKGAITVGKIFELMPFENELVLVQISGEQLQSFFDIIAAKGGDSVGGARFLISNEKAKNVIVDGEKLIPEEKYWVATNDYIANGGDGMDIFVENFQMINTGKKIRDIIISGLEEKQKKGEQLKAVLDGRIRNE